MAHLKKTFPFERDSNLGPLGLDAKAVSTVPQAMLIKI